MSHEEKVWTIQYSDLEQLASDLGIHTSMYTQPTNIGKTTEQAPPIQPAKPEPRRFPYIRYSQRDKAWIIVVDALVYIDGNTAGELLNAGIPFRP